MKALARLRRWLRARRDLSHVALHGVFVSLSVWRTEKRCAPITGAVA